MSIGCCRGYKKSKGTQQNKGGCRGNTNHRQNTTNIGHFREDTSSKECLEVVEESQQSE